MNREAIIEQLKIIVKPYIQNQQAFSDLTEETDFINDLRINSANLVDVILDNKEMEQMINVKASLDVIAFKLSEK